MDPMGNWDDPSGLLPGIGTLPAALMFDYPSARSIAEHLVDRSKGLAWSGSHGGKLCWSICSKVNLWKHMILQQKKQNKQRLQNVNVDAWEEFRL